MIAGGRGRKMPCEGCAVQFSVFKRKRVCCECERYYCSGCLRRGGGAMCAPCRVLSTRPLYRNTIAHLKVRDLQCFLQRQNVSTRGCVEKDELVNLCVLHVNGASYRRSGARSSGAFSSLKGLTTNINDFLNSAFDLRTAAPSAPSAPAPAPQPQQARRVPNGRGSNCGNCFNAMHGHRAAPADGSASVPPPQPHSERFTTTPGGERDIEVPVPAGGAAERAPSAEARVESADCFEIEDLDDSVWEFVARPPAAPLPDDSDVLLTATDSTALRDQSYPESPAVERPAPADERAGEARLSTGSRNSGWSDFERIPDTVPRDIRSSISRDFLTPGLSGSPRSLGLQARASSSLELRSQASTPSDTASLKDELGEDQDSLPVTPKRVTLEQMKHPSELDALNVKQLKELLTRNRVEYRGCIERHELLQRAKLLWRDHAQYKDEIDNLPLEECCKICMAAPLECVLLECGHIAACTACSKQLAECPICRQYVVRAVRFFRS